MLQSRGARLSGSAAVSAPSTLKLAVARSAPRPTRTAEMLTGAPAGTLALVAGAMVRTIGAAGAGEGEAAAAAGAGLSASAGEGEGSASALKRGSGERVGGTAEVAV